MSAYQRSTANRAGRAGLTWNNRRVTLSPAPAPVAPAPAPLEAGQLQLRAVAPHVRLGTDDAGGGTRTIAGTITTYETPSSTQGIVIHEGSLEARQPLTRVKLLRDHNVGDPVGYMTELSADALTATFYVPEGENGDRALQEASDHLRDGLSIGFAVKQYAFDDDYNLHVYEAELYEVSLCSIPDMADAGVTDVAMAATNTERNLPMNEQQLRAALAAGTISQAVFDRELAKLSAGDPQPAPAPSAAPVPAPSVEPHTAPQGVPEELRAGPQTVPQSTAPGYTMPRGLSLHDAARRVSTAFGNISGDVHQQVRLALNDITPANDAGTGFIGRADWIGELWTASAYSRPWIEAIGEPAALTSSKRKGWRWVTKPTVDEYNGYKEEVPTSTAQTEDDEWAAFRVAAGWDIDRIFIDLPDQATPDYVESFWGAATDEYKTKSNASIRRRIVSGVAAVPAAGSRPALPAIPAAARAMPVLPADTTIVQFLKRIIRDGRAVDGGRINRIFLGDQLFTELEDLDTGANSELPLWLKSATISADIETATANVNGLAIVYDASLDATQSCYFDNRALVVREKQPFQLKAFDVAHAGIDLGFFSYLMLENHDPRLVFKRSRGVPAQQ